MARFRDIKTLQKFASAHASIHNHFNLDRHLNRGTEELYDHSRDPWEWKNLASDPDRAGVMAEHRKWLPKQEAGRRRNP